MENRELKDVFYKAQMGDSTSIEKILKMFEPLVYKNSLVNGKIDLDCFQELNIKLINCIKKFKFFPEDDIYKCFEKFI